MARPKTKSELLLAAESNYDKLWQLIDNLSESELNTPFDFSNDTKKTEAHWQRDKNLRDVLIHLYEWHQLLMNWIKVNQAGDAKPFLPAPYDWKTYGDMNVEFFKKHQKTPLDKAKKIFQQSHRDVISLLDSFSDEQLFTKKYYNWTGTTSLGSYCISSTSSHYDWAIKKLKAHKKSLL